MLFKLPHPSADFSGSENGYIREKIDLHIHWMSELRHMISYIMVRELQKSRMYPKSQVKILVEWCCKLKN